MLQDLDDQIRRVNARLDSLGLPSARHKGDPIPRLSLPLEKPETLASVIEHTQLKANTTPVQIEDLCRQVDENDFYGVCVQPLYIQMARGLLENQSHKVITVVGFPLGATLSTVKAFEAAEAVRLGADEIDMVLPVGLIIARDYATVYEDIRSVVNAAAGSPVKVIVETAFLEQEDKVAACLISVRAGASFIKTSTGFAGQGATINDVKLFRRVIPDYIGIKAAGGIRNFKTAVNMLKAGANRIGCSASVKILREAKDSVKRAEN